MPRRVMYVFRPAIAVMERLSFNSKLAALSLLFLLPFGAVFGLYLSELNRQLAFARQERAGAAALLRLEPVMEQLIRRRDLGCPVLGLSVEEQQQQFGACDNALRLAVERWHRDTPQLNGFSPTSPHCVAFQRRLRDLPSGWGEVSPAQWRERHQEALAESVRLFNDLADASNLILDPDLDVLYLTLAVSLRLPEFNEDLGQLCECLEAQMGGSRTTRATSNQLAALQARLQRAEERIAHHLQMAEQHSPVLDQEMRAALQRHLAGLQAMSADLARWNEQPALVTESDALPLMRSASSASAHACELMQLGVIALDRSLSLRVDRLWRLRAGLIGGSLLCLTLATYLLIGCGLGLRETVARVNQTTQALLDGRPLDEQWATRSTDELGALLRDFHRVTTRLRCECRQAQAEAARAVCAEAEASRLRERVQLVLDASAEGIWDWNLATSELYYSPRVRELLGYGEDDAPPMLWSSFESLLHPDDIVPTMAAIQQHFVTRQVIVTEFRLQTRDLGYRWFTSRGQAVWDADGRPLRMAGSLSDITELRNLEEERQRYLDQILESQARIAAQAEDLREQAEALTLARDQAEAGTQAKSAFLANMSHELRTPLTAILGYSDMLHEEGDLTQAPPARLKMIESIGANGKHLLRLINDILDLSKIEAGKMSIEQTPCLLPQLLEELRQLTAARAQAQGLALEISTEGMLPRVILSDSVRLQQILVNLVGNAVKFTQSGTVRVVCRAVSQSPAVLEIAVSDTGIGMSPEQIQRLFQPFSQADVTTTRKFGGTGLGLSISQRLAQLLGGDIIVDSQPGMGSTFTLRWNADVPANTPWSLQPLTDSPRAAVVAVAAPVTSPTTLVGARILVVDDVEANRKLVGHMLAKAGAQTTFGVNGQEAVDQVLSATPDLLLLDMQMPVKDGYTVARELRERGFQLPILAMTAHAMAEDREKCLQAGCHDYLTKPIDRRQLLQLCEHWLEESRAAASGVPAR